MSLLDRIGTILKGATAGSKPASDPKTTPASPTSAGGSGSFSGGNTPSSTASAPETEPATGTKGLFGGEPHDQSTTTAPTTAAKTEPKASTKGLFGGESDDQQSTAAPAAAPLDTKGLFGGPGVAAPPSSTVRTDGPTSTKPLPPADAKQDQILPVHPKVLMIVHNPPIPSEGGKKLTQVMKWHDPAKLAQGYIDDLKNCSGGYLNYQIVERVDSDVFPVKADGFQYTAETYLQAWRDKTPHDPDWIDLDARMNMFDLQNKFTNGDFDEVWFFSFPFGGDYESRMGGPDAFWCNAPPMKNTDRFKRRFVMMGFSMERGVDCMLENFGHRTESIMTELYKRRGKKQDMWKLFTQYEKQNPGNAQCGWMHYAPNSVQDYDWGNTTKVTSYCDDWYTYPELPHIGKTMDNTTWGGGDMRAHHLWWFEHLPKVTGETDGISNNWWEYAVDPNKV